MEEKENKNEESIFNQILEEENKIDNKKEKKSLFGGVFGKKSNSLDNENFKEEVIENTETNIFSELSGGIDFGGEEVLEKKEEIKDKIYYLKKTSTGIFYLNIFLFLGILLFWSYLYIQKSDKFLDKAYLDSVCFLFLGENKDKITNSCSSVSSLYLDYQNKKQKLEQNIVDKLSLIGEDVYLVENFINSKEVSFLVDKNNNRLKVINILKDFDNMKNDYLLLDKKQIECESISIDSDFTLKTICYAYSSNWDDIGIIGTSGDKSNKSKDNLVSGTSISVASSFLNFIEKNPNYNFELLNKQNIFDSETILGEGTYTRKTKINLELKYKNTNNILSL